jgi:hypothetical protein
MPSALLLSGPATIALILVAMAIIAAVEAVVPLHARAGWHRDHLGPNLALTFLTFATNALLNLGLLALVLVLETHGVGLLRRLPLSPLASAAVAVAAFDRPSTPRIVRGIAFRPCGDTTPCTTRIRRSTSPPRFDSTPSRACSGMRPWRSPRCSSGRARSPSPCIARRPP